MKSKYHDFQTKLLNLVLHKFKNKSTALNYLSGVFGISARSALHDRLTGKTPISFEQAALMMSEQGISIHEIAPEFNMPNKTVMAPSSMDSALLDYIQWLQDDMQKLSASTSSQIWHKTDNMPIFWLNEKRVLAAFKLYFWQRALSYQKGTIIPPFNEAWYESPSVAAQLDKSKKILQLYKTIPSTEIWSVGMFDGLIGQIKNLEKVDGILEQNVVKDLRESVTQVIDYLYAASITGHKDFTQKTGVLRIYENKFFSKGNLLLGNADETGFMYLDTGYPDFIRHIDPKLVLDRLQRLRMMRPNLILITESEYNQVDFFKRLRIQVELLFE
jgi:hypothetical protein